MTGAGTGWGGGLSAHLSVFTTRRVHTDPCHAVNCRRLGVDRGRCGMGWVGQSPTAFQVTFLCPVRMAKTCSCGTSGVGES